MEQQRFPVLVHRVAALLRASFRPCLARTPLRLASPVFTRIPAGAEFDGLGNGRVSLLGRREGFALGGISSLKGVNVARTVAQ